MSIDRERLAWTGPVSPCIGVCALDARGYCKGCLRTGDEIARWTGMSAAEQWRLLARLGERRERLHTGGPEVR